ncbi:MAG: GntR family transcriptional regulator [Thermotogota bacterium]
MKLDESSTTPLFVQIAEIIEDMILDEEFKEGEQIFSTNQLAESFKINPATARKGFNILVDQNIIYKKRGVGMFVKEGAKEVIKNKRKKHFFENYLLNMIHEAKKLNISKQELINMIKSIEEGEENE